MSSVPLPWPIELSATAMPGIPDITCEADDGEAMAAAAVSW
ncbi:hypothetical protein [Streptomyces ipomoeae]|nr:hypothetical protein [Streptomyces ipomoeae]MDX2936130.1 hypothetical protein [Streptomyces ipomoeae]